MLITIRSTTRRDEQRSSDESSSLWDTGDTDVLAEPLKGIVQRWDDYDQWMDEIDNLSGAK